MRYADDVIEEVRARNDIVDIVSGYVKLKRSGSSYFGLCPFHNEKSPSFSVSPDRQMYHCFGCGVGGNVFTFMMRYENMTFQEAVKNLADRAGVKLPETAETYEDKIKADKKSILLEIQKIAAGFYYHKLRTDSGKTAMAYLKGRALSDETIRNFGLGFSDRYSNELYKLMKSKGYNDDILNESGLFRFDEKRGVADKFWNRVMFPIMDANSKVIGFGGRVMGDGKPKYLNSPETLIFDKSRNLYGLNFARRSRRNSFIICEGYMDVISMHQAGYTNAVASLGTALTSPQCSLIHRFTKNVYVIYDMDEAGIKAALRAIPMLREVGLNTKVVDLRPYKDPDEFMKAEGAEAFEERLQKAENSFLFEVRMMERDFDLQDPQGRSDFFHQITVKLLTLEDEIERDSYIQAIARLYRVEEDVLQRQVKKQSLVGTGRKEIRVQSLQEKKPQRDSSETLSQKLMLTWLTTIPELIPKLSSYLSPEDFANPLYREVAQMVFTQSAQGKVNPAEIINHFYDEEQQTEVASLFQTTIRLETAQEKEKAISEVFFNMKADSLKQRMKALDPTDLQGLMRLTDEKQKLERLRGEGLSQLLT